MALDSLLTSWQFTDMSALREDQREATRARIIGAAAEGASPASLAGLTFAEVAARAGVSERTVYRHFPTQRALHEAVVQFLEQQAGWTLEDLTAEALPDLGRRAFPVFERYGGAIDGPEPPALRDNRRRRYQAIARAIEPLAHGAEPDEVRAVAAVLQALFSFDTYRRMARYWDFDAVEAGAATSWAIEVLLEHLRGKGRTWPKVTQRRRRR
jgi:AcrR family transcriptional regulator